MNIKKLFKSYEDIICVGLFVNLIGCLQLIFLGYIENYPEWIVWTFITFVGSFMIFYGTFCIIRDNIRADQKLRERRMIESEKQMKWNNRNG